MNSRFRKEKLEPHHDGYRFLSTVSALAEILRQTFERGKVRPQTGLRQKFDSIAECFGALLETQRDPMKSAAAGNLGGRDVRKGNCLLDSSAANRETVAAIEHFVGEPVNLRVPKEKDQCRAKNPDGNRARQRISPQLSVQQGWRTDKENQRNRGEPNPPLEKGGVFKGDGPQWLPCRESKVSARAAYQPRRDRASWC